MILAAGASERFGATKLVAEVAGRPLVAHAVAAAHAAGTVDRVLLVVGHDDRAVTAAARAGGDVEVVVNPHHAAGQATSLRAGVRAAERLDAGVAVVLLGDQPGVTATAVRSVAGAVRDGAAAARVRYADGRGHPVAFARRVFDRVAAVTGDTGARRLLDDLDVAEVAVAGPVPRDVDTAADLARVRRDLRH